MTDKLYSIGELAERTGIAPETIRVWERRYGLPVPVRLPSGHRRYGAAELRLVRKVAEAMSHGHRPGKLLTLSERELDHLLTNAVRGRDVRPSEFEAIFEAVGRFRREALRVELQTAQRNATDPVAFLDDVLGPLLDVLGSRWADGSIAVRHEHFLSEAVDDVLRTMRTTVENEHRVAVHTSDVRTAVMATLPGERHGLGLQMAALTLSVAGYRVVSFGTELPIEEIEAAALEVRPQVLALSVSLASGGLQTDRAVRRLRAVLPNDVSILVGGSGARRSRRGVQGVVYLAGLRELAEYSSTQAQTKRAR
ncbi:MAG: MerR family DNA-binding transcriptional regulator [Planctomycetes bacterium]|nr:MerR family DNA-binding transcriptional regulator [Planctomycetota bacterium]MCB9890364.1 MerR family DNA-binding transcriptional regulator [Planctomycetota bacterium]MCB9918182.1 MerR family DNA-binding transcriptional regulator [Planctomycetota bacterium]